MNIYCIGRNYANHAKELGNEVPETPVVFIKSFSALRSLASAEMAFASEEFHFEAEIVLKIAKDVPMGSSPGLSCVNHVALGLDITRRGVQAKLKEKGLPWALAKSFKGSSIVSDFVELPSNPLKELNFEFYLNGALKQKGNPEMMLFSFETIINYLASYNDLKEGDLIYTGTPEGVDTIKKNDQFLLKLVNLDKEFSGVL